MQLHVLVDGLMLCHVVNWQRLLLVWNSLPMHSAYLLDLEMEL